jgi:hypothetical protein
MSQRLLVFLRSKYDPRSHPTPHTSPAASTRGEVLAVVAARSLIVFAWTL